MFKSSRWRSEKNKIKAVFKLQFHATQVKGDALMVSVVPADVGKPTVRSEKATVRDGSCYWENGVLETVKFVREPKTGKIHERIYNFVVGTGSSKTGLVGEASIDFSSYADATKVSLVSLPLKNSKSEAVLHVSIQRIQDSADQSVVEETENAKVNSLDRSLRSQLSNSDFEAIVEDKSIEDDLAKKPASQNAGKKDNCRTSSESDITLSSSGSSSGLDIPCEVSLKNNTGHHEQINFPSSLNHALVPFKQNSNVSTTVHEESPDVQWEWMGGSAFEASTDASAGTPKEALLLTLTSQEDSDVVEKLKTDLIAMARQADMTDLELQTLRKQIVRESKRGMDLSKEVASLKEERDALKEECDKYKASQRRMDDTRSKDKLIYDNGDIQALVDELRQELNYQKDLNANLQIQLQKTQESNSELILAVRDLDEMLEQKNQEITSLPNKSTTSDDAEKFPDVISNSKNEMSDEDDEEQKALEQLVREHTDAKDTHVLEQKIMDLHGEIEICRRDRDELEMQMEQLALDYEILKQENHDMSYKLEQSELQEQLKMQYECSSSYATVGQLEAQIDSLENELKKQSEELSDSLVTISELEVQVRNLEEELEKQAQEFEADLSLLTRDKVEQEQRAIRAEEALRKTRWQNASTAERLQEEFKRLTVQMASTFEANEKLASKAMNEANEFRLKKMHLENMLRKSSEELQSTKDHHEVRVFELSSQVSKMSGQIEKLQTEVEEKSMQIQRQEELAKENHLYLSQKIIILEAEIENLLTDKKISSDHEEQKNSLMAELDKMRTSIKDMELLVEQGHNERSELETKLASVRKDADESLKELNNMKSLKDEKEALARKLQSEVDNLKTRCNEMKRMLFEDEVEKEKLKKQVSQLKGDLKKKEDALNGLDKKLKDANSRVIASNGMKTISKNNKPMPASAGSREVASLKEKIKLLEGQIKRKESALESSTNSFLEKERDLQDRIEELDQRLEELSQNAERLSEQESRKVVAEALSPEEDESPNQMLTRKSMESSASNTRHLEELSSEVEQLKKKNNVMEDELMEMQERYSELSLKFAEVEGERQQLVMKLRNAKKNP
ncbi:cingulin isoform X2 [Solanum pennellii]|uniref:Cingulin isoform X2 n=1 Tax=Solanum pennellii TaxID=28526 RepID=A0ABM1HG69_SOLPN|nr:cingulin isoform X2 [Solanum pennellii]